MALPPSAPPGAPKGGNVVPIRSHGHDPHGGHGRRHKKQEHHEEGAEDGEGNWIISYADMMTLLCVFFVLMYSMANPDPKKYEEFKKETVTAFGGQYKKPYQQLVDKLQEVIKQQGLEKVVKIEADETGVSATFQGTVFFDSGKTDLLNEGTTVLQQVGDVIRKEAPGFRVVVEGHTDDVPIVSNTYPSNWELSGARSARVVRMFESMGFDRKLLTAIGFADTKPLVPNRDAQGAAIPQNQSQNRRVILRVIKNEQTSLMPGGI